LELNVGDAVSFRMNLSIIIYDDYYNLIDDRCRVTKINDLIVLANPKNIPAF
jgi:hypothetical protein